MSAGIAVIVCFVVLLGAVIGCLASYHEGRFKGYLSGYSAGRKAGQRDILQKVNAVKKRSLAAQAAIDYLYERARSEVEQLGSEPASPGGGTDQP